MIRWTLLALLGVVIAAVAAYGANQLATQPVGLTSEPLSAGQRLAPRTTRTPRPTPTATTSPVTPVTPVPTDDHGGESGGHGSDD